ncbi:hypothetical protein E8E11_003813 [Didymella keratinophila]|nr:hypothetical protein E8E11_003813 [Didymella keratinophila]
MNAPGENLPSYTEDVSPPLYAVDSDEEDLGYVASFYNSYLSSGRRRRASPRDNDRDVELGLISDESMGERERFLRRIAASARSAREQYEFTDTGRADNYGADRSNTPRRSASGTRRPEPVEDYNPSRGAQGWNHSWASPVSQSPPDYDLSQMQAARAAPSPASTVTTTPEPSNASTPASRTSDVSLLSTPCIPIPCLGIPPPGAQDARAFSPPDLPSAYLPSTHIPVTEPPGPSSLARLGPNPFLNPSSRTPSPRMPAAARVSTTLERRAARISALGPVATCGPLQRPRATATTTTRRCHGTKKPGWKSQAVLCTIFVGIIIGVGYGIYTGKFKEKNTGP